MSIVEMQELVEKAQNVNNLTRNEKDFVIEMQELVDMGTNLTYKQIGKLEGIVERKEE